MQGLRLDTALSPTASLNHASAAEPLSGLHETLIRKQDRFLFSRFFFFVFPLYELRYDGTLKTIQIYDDARLRDINTEAGGSCNTQHKAHTTATATTTTTTATPARTNDEPSRACRANVRAG